MLEIDFFPVGDGSKSGDAIALRMQGAYDPRPFVVVIDGGYLDDGEAIVEHVRTVYRTDTVDLVLGTHSDSDHINGLKPVLTGLNVLELGIHQPWLYTDEMSRATSEVRLAKALGHDLSSKFERSLSTVSDLTSLAAALRIPIVDPFAGFSRFNGALTVLGPTKDYYCDLLSSFRSAPVGLTSSAGVTTLLRKALESAKSTLFDVFENATIETLTNGGTTAAENAASVITMIRYGTERFLFTGDAGIESLTAAADSGNLHHLTTPLSLFQAPHHGSKHNLSPDILDRLLGPKGGGADTACIVSAAEGSEKHPSRRVLNALARRTNGAWVTNGRLLTISRNSSRSFSSVAPEPFHTWVESEG